MMSTRVRVLAAALLAATAVGGVTAGQDSPLRFRGVGSARQALDAMHHKPFDQTLWSALSDWTGDVVTGESIADRPVMIVTWASFHRVSLPFMKVAEGIWQKHKGAGLVVVGVHNPRGFEMAAGALKELGVTFPTAADMEGKFRGALRADQDPNIYLIDRAGNMRFARLDPQSAEQAAAMLVAETPEQARGVPTDLAARREQAEREKWRTSDLKGGGLNEQPEVTFAAPEEEAYAKAKWPYIVGKVERDDVLERVRNDPPKIQMPGEDEWMPSQPRRGGRITVMYFVDPRNVDMLRVLPVMNALHDQYKRDVVVAGAVFRGRDALKNDASEDEKHKQRNQELIEQMLKTHPVNHSYTTRVMKADNLEFSEESLQARISQQRESWAFAIVVGTDDKLRWLGNPYGEDMRRSLDRIIAVDPGVQARRAAEAALKK